LFLRLKGVDLMDQMVAIVQQWLNDTYSLGVTVDGITGNATFTALIKALQTEIGVTVDGDFGTGTLNACPTMQEVTDVDTATPSNLHYILQGSFWCKGYNPGGFTGIFGPSTTEAVKEFQADAGIDQAGIVTPYILQGIMNTDGYGYTETDDTEMNYKHEVQMRLNKYYGDQIGLIAPNGDWGRKSHRNLIKACQIEWGISVDGIWGSGTMNAAPTLSINTSGYTNSKRLLQWSLAINGFYADNLEGTFNTSTKEAVTEFQELIELGADGIAGKNTWASLLVSYGNTSWTGTACDTATRLDSLTVVQIKNAGYDEVGRYLTNVEGSSLDKKMTDEELQFFKNQGLKVFPIFQTYGGAASYFSREQGRQDAAEAKSAARNFGFPSSTVIYFTVDYDVLMADIKNYIVPYFRGIKEVIGASFRIGIYGPRAVCNTLFDYGLAVRSFVSDMSSGFTGNIGVKMPSNWAYDQIVTITAGLVSIDKCIASSSKKTAVSPSDFVEYDDSYILDPNEALEQFAKIYNYAKNYIELNLSDFPFALYDPIYSANELALQYLRSSGYEGILWNTIAGERDSGFINYVAAVDPNYDPQNVAIVDPDDYSQITFPHFAATLNACICSTIFAGVVFEERDVDSFAGWAGDLLQFGSMLELAADQGYDYFNNTDIAALIGSTPESISNYHLFTTDSDGTVHEMDTPTSVFGLEDLY